MSNAPDPTPIQPDSWIDDVLFNYRSLVADLVEDRHSRGITTKDLKVIDAIAKSELLRGIETMVQEQLLNPTLKAMIDADLFPTSAEYAKMVGLLEWQKARLAVLLDGGEEHHE